MKEDDILLNYWWGLEGEYVAIYSEDLKTVKKLNIKPMATYINTRNNKIFAYQYKVEINSNNHKKLTNELDLSDKDEYKVKYDKKKKAEVALS